MSTLLDIDKQVFLPPELGCVLYLPGLPGGGSKIYDRSPYSNHGSITGATWVRTSGGLWCLSFDGSDDYVDCGEKASLDITQAITIEMWFNPTDFTNTHTIVAKWAAGAENYVAEVYQSSGALLFEFRTVTGYNNPFGDAITAAVWTHVVFQYDGTNILHYINGTCTKNVAAANPGALVTTAASAKIGAISPTAGFAKGLINGVRIYNRALSALEIQNHFNREKHLFGVC